MNRIQIVYPADLFNPAWVDETFVAEYEAARQKGIHCLLPDSEVAALGKYRFSA